MTQTQETLEVFEEAPVGIEEDIPDEKTYEDDLFVVKYGVRTRDNAVVVKFYAPGSTEDEPADWDDIMGFADILDGALAEVYPKSSFDWSGQYVPEAKSFSVVVPGAGLAIDPIAQVEYFLGYVMALGRSDSASES